MSDINPTIAQVVVEWNQRHQEIDGFGASFAKQAHLLMRFDEPGRSEILDLLFSQTAGIGLSIIRNQINCKSPEIDPDYGSIQPDEQTWDFTHDQAQVWVMNQAKSRGTTRFFSTVLSPPAWMKRNKNCVDAKNPPEPEQNTLRPDKRQALAEYLSRYVREYKSRFDLDIYAVSIANEPEYSRPYQSATWSGAALRDFLKQNLKPTFARDGVPARVIIPESGAWDETRCALATLDDPEASAALDIVGLHNYNIDTNTREPVVTEAGVAKARAQGKRIWQTEVSYLGTDDVSMRDGLCWAKNIHGHMVVAQSNAWVWWVGTLAYDSGFDFGSGQGLIYIKNETAAYEVRKRLYSIGNYSRFVRPGYTRIGATANPAEGIYVSAFQDQDPAVQRMVIVAINDTPAERPVEFTLKGAEATTLTPYVTSPSLNLVQLSSVPVALGSALVTLPAESVTTLVGSVKGLQSGQAHRVYLPRI